MFKDVYNAIYNQLNNNTTLAAYVSNFEKAFKENYPRQPYTVILEPLNEVEATGKRSYPDIAEFVYQIDIYARMEFQKQLSEIITGYTDGGTTYKGLLEFTDDIKNAIRELGNDLITNYNTKGYSESNSNTGSTFDLTPSQSTITVIINGKTSSGYNNINCGSSTLSGSAIATNIQTSLRALGTHSDDGYLDATVTFDSETNKFKIESYEGPQNYVTVSAGASNDCSVLLGYDNPTEERGKNIIDYTFDTITVDNLRFPVRYRIIPLLVTEEVYVGG